jgi:hypothetical protein
LAATDETAWAKKVISGISEVGFGFVRLKKVSEKWDRLKL